MKIRNLKFKISNLECVKGLIQNGRFLTQSIGLDIIGLRGARGLSVRVYFPPQALSGYDSRWGEKLKLLRSS